MAINTKLVIGMDEVGRGPWAGPVVACAVALEGSINGLKDSKQLSEKKRIELDKLIRGRAEEIGIGWVSAEEIDELGLAKATQKAFMLAYVAMNITPDEIIIDGNINYLENEPNSRAVVRADSKFPVVMAASIVAKVARDKYMVEMSSKYPGYGFESHKGYGTSEHSTALNKLGVTPIHRRSFKPIAKLL